MHRGDRIPMAEELKYAGACSLEAPPPGREPCTSCMKIAGIYCRSAVTWMRSHMW